MAVASTASCHGGLKIMPAPVSAFIVTVRAALIARIGGRFMPVGDDQPPSAARRSRLFATCIPGLGRLMRRQLESADGVEATGTGNDGRADIVFVEAGRDGRAEVLRSRLAEQVFAEI